MSNRRVFSPAFKALVVFESVKWGKEPCPGMPGTQHQALDVDPLETGIFRTRSRSVPEEESTAPM